MVNTYIKIATVNVNFRKFECTRKSQKLVAHENLIVCSTFCHIYNVNMSYEE